MSLQNWLDKDLWTQCNSSFIITGQKSSLKGTSAAIFSAQGFRKQDKNRKTNSLTSKVCFRNISFSIIMNKLVDNSSVVIN